VWCPSYGRGSPRCRFRCPQSAVGVEEPEAHNRRRSTHEAHLAIFDQAAAIIASEFSRPLRIEDVAQGLAVSPRHLQRVFSDVAGVGFRSYLRRVRMCHAAELLRETSIPAKEVGRRVGYRDPSQFSKAFKRTYGVSPTQVRPPHRRMGTRELDAFPPDPELGRDPVG
jgi:AraC family transcriptional regulator, regulatory protein of adaptative response / methylphosphotriester-DNA alkyltransferase methyltransferase